MSDAAATAIELIHCASLVHDDMPCFDNADIRRGKPTVHRAYGEPLALLTGDTLIVAAFEVLARAAATDPERAVTLIRILGESTGMPGGICAGQGWESEDKIDLSAYHRAKTGALFTAATRMGAAARARSPTPGPSSARASVRRSRSPTICATRSTTKRRSASPPIRMRSTAAQRGGGTRRERVRSGGSRISCPAPSPRSRPAPGEAALCDMVRKTAERLTPVVPAQQTA
jgi:geranylgeranyl diphosphate synthase type II